MTNSKTTPPEPDAENTENVPVPTEPAPPLPTDPAEDAADALPAHVVGGEDRDDVYLSACVFGKKQKSLTVHHLQRRLTDLGFDEASADNDGRYGELTRRSVAAYQTAKMHPDHARDGLMDSDTFQKVFARDKNVRVILR